MDMWYFSGSEMNTNNICESFHSRLTAAFTNVSHPSIDVFARMIDVYEKRQMRLLTRSATTTFMQRVKKAGQTVAAILKTLNNKFSGGMIQSLKEYLTALNNSFDQSVDSATARTAPGRDDIDDDEFSSGPVDTATQVQLISEPLNIEDSQMASTLPLYPDLVHGRETEDTQDQQGGEVMSCTLYPPYSM